MSDRQKYNFLAAWTKQLDNAMDDGDDLALQVNELLGLRDLLAELDSIRKEQMYHEERIAAMEELDDDWSESSGEEPESDDDGDYDKLVGGDGTSMGSAHPTDGRVAPPVAGAASRRRPPPSRELRAVGCVDKRVSKEVASGTKPQKRKTAKR